MLVAGDNFGCGSSREHAPWALEDYGFNVVIAPSYADIFYNNCFKNGILPITLLDEQMDQFSANEGVAFGIDLVNQNVTTPGGISIGFNVDGFRKHNLLNGLDDIGLTLAQTDKIDIYEAKHKQTFPWLWAS